MDEKKNIDRLFQEKFKDYEILPDASVWKDIEKRLEKKKKRRIVPLWWQIGGAAAILLLLISTGFWFFDKNEHTTVPSNDINVITNTNKEKQLFKEKIQDKTLNNEVITFEKPEEEVSKNNTNIQDNNSISKVTQQKATINTVAINKPDKFSIQKKERVSANQNKMATLHKIESKNIGQLEKYTSKKSIEVTSTAHLIDSLKTASTIKETVVAEVTQDKQVLEEKQKVDIQKEIEENNKLEKAIEKNKWSVGSTVSPVYYNTLGKGSPIDPSLKDNKKNSDNTIAYGLKVNYKLSNKLSLQSGINTLELGYTTKNVTTLISSTLLSGTNTNINTNIDGVSVATLSAESQSPEAFSQRSSFDISGTLNQSLSYVEVPLEIKYNVLQKKLGIHIIGGVSTYFLYQNKVSITSFDKTTTLGTASNLNSLNFSGNLGFDFDYNLSKKLYLNVSPMFKYQFHTFSKNAGGFKPYYLGIYTGLNYRF